MRMFSGEALDHKKIDELYQQSAWGKIIQSFAKADLQQVDDVRVLNDLAVAYHQERQFDKALTVCERIKSVEMWTDLVKQQAELTPRYMRYHVIMGEVLYRMDEMEKALEIFTKLKAIGSRFSDKYYYSGRIHTKMGNYRQALLEFKGMISHTPQRMRDVIRGLGELIEASPAQAGAYEQLYAASQHKERVGHYTKKFQQEMQESKGALPDGLKVAHMLFLEGDAASGRKILSSLQTASDEEKSWLTLIEGDWVLAEKGPQDALEIYLSTEGGLPPGSPLLIERLEDLVRTHKLGAHVRKKIAQLYEAGGDADGAARHLEAVVSESGDEAAKTDLARILKGAMTAAFGANDLQRAQSMGTRYLKLFPEDQAVAGQIQQINQVLFTKKKEELEKYLAMGSRLPARKAAEFHFEMAKIEKAMMGSEEAIIAHLQGASSEKSPVRAQALLELGQIHLGNGNSDMAEAIHDILFGLKLGEDDRLAWAYELGEVYEEKGEKDLALKYFEMVTELDGTFRDAASHAGGLKRELEAAAQAAPAASTAAPAVAESTDPMTILAKRYDDIQELGRGAMGVVYKARDKILDRQVAIKMILGDIGDDPEALARFITEAQSAAALEHPGIITVYDIRTEEPMFIVMEFVEGKDIGDLLSGRKLPLGQFLKLAIRVCDPLALAHRSDVIHRDIKPDNIMVTKDGGVKIADFGLSRKGGGSGQTQVGQVMGTPFYMAPEQIRGGEVDGRSDLYSLGITFYEMLTGAVPFSEGDIAYMHMHEEPPRLSSKNPEVSRELEEIIMKCLKKEPAERYQTVDELMEALKAVTV